MKTALQIPELDPVSLVEGGVSDHGYRYVRTAQGITLAVLRHERGGINVSRFETHVDPKGLTLKSNTAAAVLLST